MGLLGETGPVGPTATLENLISIADGVVVLVERLDARSTICKTFAGVQELKIVTSALVAPISDRRP